MGNTQSESVNENDKKKHSNDEIKEKETTKENHLNDESVETKTVSQSLDIAFILDCTGSMNSYIQSCKDNINQIAQTINRKTDNKYDTQFGLILYRDIPPQDTTFITKRIDFTPIPLQIQLKLAPIRADGGGDGPECLTSALYDCYKNLKWRQNSVKVIVVITDASPHGLEKTKRDGFPNGDIDTFNDDDEKVQKEGVNDADDKKVDKYLNVIEIIKKIRNELNASIYSVACEPSLSCNYDFANDFMQYMAEYTNGKFLPLSSASLLPTVIIGSIQQQINLDNLADKLEEEIIKIKKEYGDDISNDKLNELIAEKWKNEGIQRNEISVSDIYKNKRSRENIELLMNQQVIKSLDDFKKKCKDIPRMRRSDFINLNTSSSSTTTTTSAPITSVECRKTSSKKKGSIFNGFSSLWKNTSTLSSVQQDLDAAVIEAEDGFGGDLCVGGVGFNPLATGFNPNAPAGYGGSGGGGGGDFVRPIIEKPVFRQDYGQQVATMKGSTMSSSIVGSIRSYGARKGGY